MLKQVTTLVHTLSKLLPFLHDKADELKSGGKTYQLLKTILLLRA